MSNIYTIETSRERNERLNNPYINIQDVCLYFCLFIPKDLANCWTNKQYDCNVAYDMGRFFLGAWWLPQPSRGGDFSLCLYPSGESEYTNERKPPFISIYLKVIGKGGVLCSTRHFEENRLQSYAISAPQQLGKKMISMPKIPG